MNFNNQHIPNSAREASRMFAEQEAKQRQAMEERQAQQTLDAKRHHETTSLTAKNVNLMEENNKICNKSLRISYISAIIALCALLVAIFK